MFRLFFLLLLIPQLSIANDTFLQEDFNNQENWEPLLFPKIEKHSLYTIEKKDDLSFLKCSTNDSASGLIYKKEFNVNEFPKIKWKWKVDNILSKGDATKKAGDDYPIRIYVFFKYDPKKASYFEAAKYSLAKTIYGEYPPKSSLNYIFANKKHSKTLLNSPYTDKSKMLIVDAGTGATGKWKTYERDILADYKKAFGEAPPLEASLAVMCDSDGTHESSSAEIDYITISK